MENWLLKKDGLPYITAPHDRNNPQSGGMMKNVGIKHQYSHEEHWQPKNILITFHMYQLNFKEGEDRVCIKPANFLAVRLTFSASFHCYGSAVHSGPKGGMLLE